MRRSRLPPIVQLGMYAADPLGSLERWSRALGDTFVARFPGVGEIVFTSAPAHIRTIFSASPDVLEAGPENLGLRPVVGARSVLVLDGDEHARHRRLVVPAFHGERMQRLASAVRGAAVAAIDRWPLGNEIMLRPHLEELTLELTVRALFGDHALAGPFQRMLESLRSPLVPLLAYWGVDVLERAPWLAAARRKAELDRALFAEIARRRRSPEGDDVLAMLLGARDPDGRALDDRELHDELVGLVVAGHETVAGALSWAIELLLDHPSVLARASIDGNYLDAAIKESLRLRPVLALVARRAREPFTLGTTTFAAGTWFAPSIYLTHRRADLYPDPEAFRPERFVGRKPDPFHWLPFGGGGRRCLGMGFALVEMKAILSAMLERLQLKTLRRKPAAIARRNITLVPAGDVPVSCAPS